MTTPPAWANFIDWIGRHLQTFPVGGWVRIYPAEGTSQASDPEPYVKALLTSEGIHLECIGSQSFGGDYAFTPEQEDLLAQIDWDKPDDDAELRVYTYEIESSPEEVPEFNYLIAASMLGQTMGQVLEVEKPEDLMLDGSEPPLNGE